MNQYSTRAIRKRHHQFMVALVEASSMDTLPIRLRELALHENFRVRREVAENPKTPTDVLDLLAKDKSPAVTYALSHRELAVREREKYDHIWNAYLAWRHGSDDSNKKEVLKRFFVRSRKVSG